MTKQCNISMKKAVTEDNVPILLRIRDRCVVKNKTVFKKGQYVTVLQRKQLSIVTGQDSEGRRFIMDEKMQDDIVANIVEEEFFPKNEEELVQLVKTGKINNIILKQKFNYQSLVLEAGECLSVINELTAIQSQDNSQQDRQFSKERLVSFRRELDGETVDLPAGILIKSDSIFYLVRLEAKPDTLLRTLMSKKVFLTSSLPHESSILNLPRGVVRILGTSRLDVIVTVTMPMSSKYLLYETYPLDKRIMVDVVSDDNSKLPRHVQLLVGKETGDYTEKLKEIDFLSYADCYSSRYYGYIVEENPYYEEDKDIAMVDYKEVSECLHQFDTLCLINQQSGTKSPLKHFKTKGFARFLKKKKKVKDVAQNDKNDEQPPDIITKAKVHETDNDNLKDRSANNIAEENTYVGDADVRLFNKFNADIKDRPLPSLPYSREEVVKSEEVDVLAKYKLPSDDDDSYMSMHPIGYTSSPRQVHKSTDNCPKEAIVNNRQGADTQRYTFVPALYEKRDEYMCFVPKLYNNENDNEHFCEKETFLPFENSGIVENDRCNDSNATNNDIVTYNETNSPDYFISQRRLLDYFYKGSPEDLTSIDITTMFEDDVVGDVQREDGIEEAATSLFTDDTQHVPSRNNNRQRAVTEGNMSQMSINKCIPGTSGDENTRQCPDLIAPLHNDDENSRVRPVPPPRNSVLPTPPPRNRPTPAPRRNRTNTVPSIQKSMKS